MLKKIPLRIRFTLVASLFLLVSCVTLTLLSNMSAVHMMEAVALLPSMKDGSTPILQLEPAQPVEEPYYQVFQQKTTVATILIVLAGSIATYFAAGYVLKPIRDLSCGVQKRNVENLGTPIELPQSADEVRQLTISFNQMMEDLQRSFLLQKEFSANAAHELRTPLAIDTDKCTSCGACSKVCKMDVDVFRTPNHRECIRCGDCVRTCPHQAITRTFSLKSTEGKKVKIHEKNS